MKNKKVLIAAAVVVVVALIILSFFKKDTAPVELKPSAEKSVDVIETVPYTAPENASKITGLACDNYQKRAFAVMYSGDPDAREYFSNLSLADLVLEMPHRAVHGDPRLMGIFQCNAPEIVGPMRSGRVDNISVAGSFDAIFVPWGGSSIAKAILKKDVIDHIDCNGEVAPSGGDACFRRTGPMSQMNKASTNVTELIKVAERVGYRKESNFKGYQHQGDIAMSERPAYAKIDVNFESTKSLNVSYSYDKETNSYLRSLRDGADMDYATGKQYAPKNIITIVTKKEPWMLDRNYTAEGVQDPWDGVDDTHSLNDSGGYPNMQLGDPWFDTKFEGNATFFLNGTKIDGTWKRTKGLANQFQFLDKNGNEIKFVPGQIWMHVLGDDQEIAYSENASEETDGIQAQGE